MNRLFRNQGAIGALLDEYENALEELKGVIQPISESELIKILDSETEDPDCTSIQNILTHVISAGYAYAILIRNSFGEKINFKEKIKLNSIEEYKIALNAMFAYNEKLFQDYPNIKLEEYDNDKKILSRWGQYYDVEQLFEHAIVHILRHRRQIERFKIKLNSL